MHVGGDSERRAFRLRDLPRWAITRVIAADARRNYGLMLENRGGLQQRFPTSRRVYISIAVAAACLVAAISIILRLDRDIAARQVVLNFAVRIELELALSNLRWEDVLGTRPGLHLSAVQQHLARADSYAEQIHDICANSRGIFSLGDEELLRRELAAFRGELAEFGTTLVQLWEERQGNPGDFRADPQFQRDAWQLIFRARQIKGSADAMMQVQQLAFQALHMVLIVGTIAAVSFVGLTLHRHLTRRTQVEAALRESEEKFRSVYEMSNDAVMLLDEQRYFDCNMAALQTFGVSSHEEFYRHHPADLSPARQPDGTDSLAAANQRIATALREGSHRFEWIHRRADGTEFPAEVSLSRVHIEGRNVLQAVVRDVTERRQAEQLLQANEEKFRTISEAALDAVIMMDSQGRAVHWNPAAERMFRYSHEEILGQEIHSLLIPSRFQQEAAAALSRFFRTGEGRTVGRILELQAVRKGGEEFPIEISLAPIRIDNHWSAVSVVRDITDRKKAEELLREEQRSLRRLLKSHDQERKLIAYEIHDGLAQQLVAAIMQCQAAARVADRDPHEYRKLVAELLALLRQCLSETRRLISGVRPPILDEFGVVTAIHGMIEETHGRGGPRVEFQNSVAFQRLEPVLENTIFRVIQEGLQNACRHSQTEKVLVQLTQAEGNIRLRVQDWGTGFDPRHIDSKRYGLAGIRERVRLLGGNVNIDSHPGKGTSILVELPADVGGLADAD